MTRTASKSARLISAVFFFSGLASLMYQVLWQRLLTIYLGVAPLSITLIVAVFMLGLGAGALAGGWIAARSPKPIELFALTEGLLGLVGAASYPLLKMAGPVIAGFHPAAAFGCLFALLSIPTLLMGMALPLITAAACRAHGQFERWISRLYFVNTLGASAGALISSYILIPIAGLNGSIYAAAAVNFLILAAVFKNRAILQAASFPGPGPSPPPEAAPPLGRIAYTFVFVTGFVSIGYQILGYRICGILVKDSPYAYSSTLAMYLLGLAAGSFMIEQALCRNIALSRQKLFRLLQFFLGLAILGIFVLMFQLGKIEPFRTAITTSFMSDLHPPIPGPSQIQDQPLHRGIFQYQDIFLWPAIILFIPSALAGASFPLIAALAPCPPGREGRAVGNICFFGALGNIMGGLFTGLVLLPRVGTERAALALGLLAASAALVPRKLPAGRPWGMGAIGALMIVLPVVLFPGPGELLAVLHAPPFPPERMELEEGLDSVVLTYQAGDRYRNYINGQGHGYRPGAFFIAEALETLSHTIATRQVLVIGFGAGNIAEAVLAVPELEKLTLVELNPSLISNLRKFALFRKLLSDPRMEIVLGDGRAYLAKSGAKFDAILMDPLRTTTAYSNNLHSRQFFKLVHARLSDEGILMVGGLMNGPVIARTLLTEFEFVRLYPGFCIASPGPLNKNADRFDRMAGLYPPDIRNSWPPILEQGVEGAALMEMSAGYPINEDWRPESEYYLALEIKLRLAGIQER